MLGRDLGGLSLGDFAGFSGAFPLSLLSTSLSFSIPFCLSCVVPFAPDSSAGGTGKGRPGGTCTGEVGGDVKGEVIGEAIGDIVGDVSGVSFSFGLSNLIDLRSILRGSFHSQKDK